MDSYENYSTEGLDMKIAFLGDSITYGYDLSDRSKRYSTVVKK